MKWLELPLNVGAKICPRWPQMACTSKFLQISAAQLLGSQGGRGLDSLYNYLFSLYTLFLTPSFSSPLSSASCKSLFFYHCFIFTRVSLLISPSPFQSYTLLPAGLHHQPNLRHLHTFRRHPFASLVALCFDDKKQHHDRQHHQRRQLSRDGSSQRHRS